MNKSRLLFAIAALIGLSVAVALTKRSHQAETTLERPTASLPKLKKEDLTEIAITRPDKPTVVLKKQGEKWRVSEPVDDRAAPTAVDGIVEKLAELAVTSVAATKKENHERLEVDDKHATRVVAKNGDKVLLDLHVGAAKSGGTMVRVAGSDEVLALKGSIRYLFDRELKDFRDRDVTDIDNKEIKRVAIASNKGSFVFEREGEAPWAQAKGEKPIPNFDPSKVISFLNTAAHLYASDFAEPKDDDAVTGLAAPQSKVTLTKNDGSTVELAVGNKHAGGQDYYLRASTNPVVFRISNFNAERLIADAKLFEKDPTPPPAQAGEPPKGMPVGAGGQIPEDLMKQLQQQMQAQGHAPH